VDRQGLENEGSVSPTALNPAPRRNWTVTGVILAKLSCGFYIIQDGTLRSLRLSTHRIFLYRIQGSASPIATSFMSVTLAVNIEAFPTLMPLAKVGHLEHVAKKYARVWRV
jgi:hypothetical protein